MASRVKLMVTSDERSLDVVDAVVERFCENVTGIRGEGTAALVGLIREAVRFTLDHAYPGDPTGEVELALQLVDGRVHVSIHDWGRPLTGSAAGLREARPELAWIGAGADDLRLINLGADGKRITFTASVPRTLEAQHEGHDVDAYVRPFVPDGPDVRERVAIRDATPSDAEAISQLVYDNYHLTYGHPDFYRPHWLSEQIEARAVLSSVAVVDEEIIGHHAVMFTEGWPSAETGVAVVHPAFRGLGIFTVLADHTLTRAIELGLEAVWSRAITVHPYSQRAALARGYRETGIMLGSVPARMVMQGIETSKSGTRTASILSFLMLRPSPRPASLPERYGRELTAAYANVGLTNDPPQPQQRPASAVTWTEEESRATAFLTVSYWEEASVLHALRHLLARHVDAVYADLDLTAGAASDEAVARLNGEGFFYSGLVLCGHGGHDFLRLQLLNAEDIELERIVCDSDFAKALLAGALEDRRRVDG